MGVLIIGFLALAAVLIYDHRQKLMRDYVPLALFDPEAPGAAENKGRRGKGSDITELTEIVGSGKGSKRGKDQHKLPMNTQSVAFTKAGSALPPNGASGHHPQNL